MNNPKAGIIGTGFMASTHVESIRESGIGEVIGIAGASEEMARAKGSELGIDRVYDNYMELIRDPDIQIVHSCTPNNLHFPINRAALAAGKHIISEKPLAMDLRESRLSLSASERSDVVHAVMFNYRHYPVIMQLQAMVNAGELGEIYAIHGSYLQDWFSYETDYDWRVDPMLGGNSRAVADNGSHWCDLVQFVTGLKITEVMGDVQTFLPIRKKSVSIVGTFGRSMTPRHVDVRVATEDYGSILLRFDKGVRGALTVSQVSAGRKNRLYFQIDGSSKSVAWDQEQPETLWFGYRDRPNEFSPKKPKASKAQTRLSGHYPAGEGDAWGDGVKNLIHNVYQYIADGKKLGRDPANFPTFVDGYRAAVVVDRIMVSSHQRRWVKTNLNPK